MPNRNVYGKRSRAIYDPLAAFASPQSSSPESANDLRKPIAIKAKEPEKPDRSVPKTDSSTRRRRALGEINANEVVEPANPLKCATKNKRTHRRKLVVDDSEDERPARITNDASIVSAKETPRPQEPHPRHGYAADTRVPIQDGAEDVSFANDAQDHENSHTPIPDRSDAHIEEDLPAIHSLPNTPSIHVSPPTPTVLDEYEEHCAALLELSSHQTPKRKITPVFYCPRAAHRSSRTIWWDELPCSGTSSRNSRIARSTFGRRWSSARPPCLGVSGV